MTRRVLAFYWPLCAFTAACAAVVFFSTPLAQFTIDSLNLPLSSPPASFSHFLTIVARNLTTFAVPFVLAFVFAPWRSTPRAVISSAILALAFVPSLLIVGAAIGAYGSAIAPFLWHLPLEWLALASAASVWPIALDGELDRTTAFRYGALVTALTLSAALVEVLA